MAYNPNPIPYEQRCHHCRERAAEADSLCVPCRPEFERHLHTLRNPDAAAVEHCGTAGNFAKYHRKSSLRLAAARLWPDVKAGEDRKLTILRQLGLYCLLCYDAATHGRGDEERISTQLVEIKGKLPKWARWS